MTGATQSDCCQVMRRRNDEDIIARSRRACSRAKAGAVLRRARGDFAASVVVPLGGRLASLSSCRRAAGVLLELLSQPNIICICGVCGSVRRGCPAVVALWDEGYAVRAALGRMGPGGREKSPVHLPAGSVGGSCHFSSFVI